MSKQTDFTARVMSCAQMLKSAGYPDVAAFLVKSELNERGAKRKGRKPKQILYTERGAKIELYRDVVNRMSSEDAT